jgi:hypothetical protein
VVVRGIVGAENHIGMAVRLYERLWGIIALPAKEGGFGMIEVLVSVISILR